MFLKTRLIFIVLFLFTFLSGQSISFAETEKSGQSFDQPKRLVLKGIGEPQLNSNGHFLFLTEAFYPIGFSKSGKFAYYTEPADEACGCYFATLVIQDLRTDKILWKHEYDSEPTDVVPGKQTPLPTIKEHWNRNKAMFSRKLEQYGIKAQDQFTLNESIQYREDVFTPKLNLQIEKEEVYSVDGSLNLLMVSEKKGAKSIYKKKYIADDYSGFRTAEVSGVLKSPFGSTSAVILVEMIRGYEGPPNPTRIRSVGSNLTNRFRR